MNKNEKLDKIDKWKKQEQNRYIEVRLRLALKQEIKNVMIVWTSNYFANKVILAKWLLFMLKTFVEK